ncbi:hypothetical protein PG988_000301 [Apiospora saccharicola]
MPRVASGWRHQFALGCQPGIPMDVIEKQTQLPATHEVRQLADELQTRRTEHSSTWILLRRPTTRKLAKEPYVWESAKHLAPSQVIASDGFDDVVASLPENLPFWVNPFSARSKYPETPQPGQDAGPRPQEQL